MNDSTQYVTWWLEMVKIVRKGFEVLSKGEGQATVWRSKNLARVKKKVLAFSWGTNQAMMVILIWRIKFILNKVLKVTWCIWSYSNLMNGIKSHAQDGYDQVKKIKVDMLAPLLDDDWKRRHQFKRDQLKRYKFVFPLILSLIGMPYY